MFSNTVPPRLPRLFGHVICVSILLIVPGACQYRIAFSSPLRQDKTAATGAIRFLKNDFEMRLDSAQKANQPVFIDFYTDWCGPCRRMDKDVFTDGRVSDFFNQSFLSLKVNAEKGEGIALAKKFNVSAYPTMIFLNGKGVEKERIVGMATATHLQKAGKKAKGS